MCMEDIRIMRTTGASETVTATTNAAVQSVIQDATRVALVLQNIGSNPIWIGFTAGLAINNGLLLAVNAAPLILNIIQHGSLCTRGYFVISQAALLSTLYQQSVTLV